MKINQDHIETLSELSKLLGTPVKSLVYFANHTADHVKEHNEPKKSGKGVRTITSPSVPLKKIQRLIKDLILTNYHYPNYVYGLGGNTLKQHGQVHVGRVNTIKLDLKDFYPSIKHDMVFEMWRTKFDFDVETSRILTKLTTLDGGLKQGFPTSSHIAAIVAEGFTNEIDVYCASTKLNFSQYVDDLNISGVNIDYKKFFKLVVPLSRKHRLHIKVQKTKVTSRLDGKIITGVSVYDKHTRTSKDIRHRAIRALKFLRANPKDEQALRSVRGHLGFQRHINKMDGGKYALLAGDLLTKKNQKK